MPYAIHETRQAYMRDYMIAYRQKHYARELAKQREWRRLRALRKAEV